ncbi:MAG: NAD-dependent epimerase/dehydratase family protein [Granulosicoccus sp.]
MRENLLIGGAGFIGKALASRLGEKSVTVFDCFASVSHDDHSIREMLSSEAELVVGDVCSTDSLDALFENGVPDTLVYLAAETGTGRSLRNCALNARVNTLGLANTLDALSRLSKMPRKIVLTSTRAVYGEGPYQNTETGTVVYPRQRTSADLEKHEFNFPGLQSLDMNASVHFPNPSNIYGATKMSQEHLLTSWCDAFDIPAHIFRLQNVYGAGQSLTNPYTGVLIHFIKQAMGKHPVEIFENGGITRDFVHVEDVAALLAAAAQGSPPTDVFDCGSGDRVELEAVASALCTLGKAPMPVRTNAYRLGDVRHACADLSPVKAHFDWAPAVSLDDGLSDLYRWVSDKLKAA